MGSRQRTAFYGRYKGNIVTCQLHGAQFDYTTGKKVKGPNAKSASTEGVPDVWKKHAESIYNLMSIINTYHQKTYDITIHRDRRKTATHCLKSNNVRSSFLFHRYPFNEF
jgi:nitrite reductase/ring-hydroxylating ferredoxin subunit